MRQLKLLISYDGEVFFGMQKQNQPVPTVQAVIENAFSDLYQKAISITYAGRTDRGVHAKQQVVCFSDEGKIPFNKLKNVLQNSLAEHPIKILSVNQTSKELHPRYDAKWREYEYWLYTGEEQIFLNKYMVHVDSIDIKRLNDYARHFKGKKDFSLFCRSSEDKEDTIRRVTKSCFKRSRYSFLGYKGECCIFEVRANGFLHNMVRRMLGLVLHAFYHNWHEDEFRRVVETEKEYLWQIVNANGLFLKEVKY